MASSSETNAKSRTKSSERLKKRPKTPKLIQLPLSSIPEPQPSPRPFIKWAGGKKQLLKILKGLAPSNFNRYFEPFVGGGALFFELQPKNAYLSDINGELINAYTAVRDNCKKLCQALKKHKGGEEYYYEIRNADRRPSYNRWHSVSKASRLIYLNKNCYNGLYRVNSLGQFNVPFGRYKNPKWLDEDNLQACSIALKDTHLKVASFESVLKKAEKGDFVYFDPPYAPLSATSNFTTYNPNGFGQDEQLRLRDVCVELDKRGVKWMLSNSAAPLIMELYKGFNIYKVKAARVINSKGSGRGKITEVLITNY
ncbi:MAG: DNA adenine methylase [Bdellovibrionota bacterium]|jgi:DNA adenine methylase